MCVRVIKVALPKINETGLARAPIEISQDDYASRQRAPRPTEIIDLVRVIKIIGLCGEGDCPGEKGEAS